MSYGYYFDGYITELDSHDESLREAESILDDLRCEAADGWSNEVGNLNVILQTYHTVMVNERPRTDEDASVDTSCETICDYEIQPTDEWKAICHERNELRSAKRCLKDWGIKYQKDGVPITLKQQIDLLGQDRDDLAKFKRCCVFNGENDPIAIGDDVWFSGPDGPTSGGVMYIQKSDQVYDQLKMNGEYAVMIQPHDSFYEVELGNLDCYSKAETVPKVTG